MGWNIVVIVLVVMALIVGVVGSGIFMLMTYDEDRKRYMGAFSVARRDLRDRDVSWQDALSEADAIERGNHMAPLRAFAFADVRKANGHHEIDYGISIGYAPSFMSDPVKQVSYVLHTEKVDEDANTPERIERRQRLLRSITNAFDKFRDEKTGYSDLVLTTPCVRRSAYEYLVV